MTPRPIGYYVHHHGDGHRQRALAIARAMGERIVLLGTGLAGRTGSIPSIDLPDDRCDADFGGVDGAAERPSALHYAPINHDGVRRRVAIVSDWIALVRPALMVVDVSVEIAMLARLAATPTVYVRLGGRRDDPAHLDAFRGATALLAPFHPHLDDPHLPEWIQRKTVHISGLTVAASPLSGSPEDILVVLGNGGTRLTNEMLAAAAHATPDHTWRVAGLVEAPADCPSNLHLLGWIDGIASAIAGAKIVVGGAGDGVVTAVLAAGRPFICLPETRPFDEQLSKARRLAAAGVAIMIDCLPSAEAWPHILEGALTIDPQVAQRLHDPNGVAHAVAFLEKMADGAPDVRRLATAS